MRISKLGILDASIRVVRTLEAAAIGNAAEDAATGIGYLKVGVNEGAFAGDSFI